MSMEDLMGKAILESIKDEKEALLKQYYEKTEAKRKEIDALEAKIEDLDKIFAEEYRNRVADFEKKEAELKQMTIEIEAEIRKHGQEVIEFNNRKNAFEHSASQREMAISALIEKNETIKQDILDDKKVIEAENKKNHALVDAIKTDQFKLEMREKELIDREKAVEAKNVQYVQILNEANQKLEQANAINDSLDTKKTELAQKSIDLDRQKVEIGELLFKNSKIVEEIRKEKAEVEAKKEELLKIANQISLERSINNEKSVALKSKEISLYDREKALNIREKNISAVEQKLAQGESNAKNNN